MVGWPVLLFLLPPRIFRNPGATVSQASALQLNVAPQREGDNAVVTDDANRATIKACGAQDSEREYIRESCKYLMPIG